MISRLMSERPKQPVELPRPAMVEPSKIKIAESKSSESLSEMCNFDPNVIACTPPDGYFIHNLRLRMGKMR